MSEVVLRKVADLLVPLILIFGLYVIFHGESGPGGGFQGGVAVASALILYSLIHGAAPLRKVVSQRVTTVLAAVGVLFYVSVGLVTMVLGGHFLEYGVLDPEHPAAGQALGITLVELGVGLAVAAVMLTIFTELYED